jgi:hypothetical protein
MGGHIHDPGKLNPQRKSPRTNWLEDWDSPGAGTDDIEKRIFSALLALKF